MSSNDQSHQQSPFMVKMMKLIGQKDPRWGKVDEYTESHLHKCLHSGDAEKLTFCLENSKAKGLPDIGSTASFVKILSLQIKTSKTSHFLEFGTLGAYTPISLCLSNPTLRVTTLEYSEKHAAVAKENIEHAGLSDRIEVLVGPALDHLPTLRSQIESGEREPFGVAYIDADKQNNWTYFDFAVSGLMKKGGVLCVDNVVFGGALVDEDEELKNSVAVTGAKELIEKVGKDDRVEATVLQLVTERGWDGVLMGVIL